MQAPPRPQQAPPPPRDEWKPARPIQEDDGDDDIITIITHAANGPDPGGGGEEGGEQGLNPRPAAARVPRRRPPRERWLLVQHPPQQIGDQEPPVDNPIEVQQAPVHFNLQEEVEAQVQARGLTRGGRATKAPERYGFEKGREEESKEDLDISSTDIKRDLTPKGPSTASTPNISPITTPNLTPVITPDTSPDTSAVTFSRDHHWLLPPDQGTFEGRTRKQRTEDVLERHRHWSDPGPDVRPQHPRFQDWDPGPKDL